MRTTRAGVLAVALVLAVTGGTGCSQVSGGGSGVEQASTSSQGRQILKTKEWGVVDGMLSVVVENTSDRTLRNATGVITARDDADVLIATSLESPAGCCSVVDLPPGQEFGFYVDLGDSADDISRVDVAYRNVAWAPATETPANPLSARPVRIDGSGDGAVVVADVQSSEPTVAQASVQAFIDGPDGEFLAVVAGRWYCFAQGSHEIRMQLLHRVPVGATVDRIVIHPVADAADASAPPCTDPTQAG